MVYLNYTPYIQQEMKYIFLYIYVYKQTHFGALK